MQQNKLEHNNMFKAQEIIILSNTQESNMVRKGKEKGLRMFRFATNSPHFITLWSELARKRTGWDVPNFVKNDVSYL